MPIKTEIFFINSLLHYLFRPIKNKNRTDFILLTQKIKATRLSAFAKASADPWLSVPASRRVWQTTQLFRIRVDMLPFNHHLPVKIFQLNPLTTCEMNFQIKSPGQNHPVSYLGFPGPHERSAKDPTTLGHVSLGFPGPHERPAKDPIITCRGVSGFFQLFQYVLGFLDLRYAALAVIDLYKPCEPAFIEIAKKFNQFFYLVYTHTDAL
jgi:hypothetical protein